MQAIYNEITLSIQYFLAQNFNLPQTTKVILQPTRKDFVGDVTCNVFAYTKAAQALGVSAAALAQQLGTHLVAHCAVVQGFEVVQGFVNLSLHTQSIIKYTFENTQPINPTPKKILVEYASPNTNKPLHLGHLRNILLGASVANIYQALHHQVFRVQIINDRGIHICKSMVAWQLFGQGETPDTNHTKGDHLVGKYYVAYNDEYKKQVAALMAQGIAAEAAEKQAPILHAAQAMLLQWEANDPDILQLWRTMNGWVYQGFDETYNNLNVHFDKLYYESDTYLLGKKAVQMGLEQGVFYQKTDGSVWVDLTDDGLDHKLLLRADGTSVYITQDMGLGVQRTHDFAMDKSIYTVGNEQDYHFKVLFLIFKKLGYAWAANCYHLSYGMVELPTGKMKSREGTVVDTDDLIAEMVATAADRSNELGKINELSPEEQTKLHKILGLGALKYFILRIDPKKSMIFNPEESINLQGNTATFIQYAYARIQSVLRRAAAANDVADMAAADVNLWQNAELCATERDLCLQLLQYYATLQAAADAHSPAIIAHYAYETAQKFNRFYQECSIMNELNPTQKQFRIHLCQRIAATLHAATQLLGVEMPERM
jgi:arginyl-tRNA synthetase